MTDLGDAKILALLENGNSHILAIPGREGRGRLVLDGDLDRYVTKSINDDTNDGTTAAGEVRFTRNVAAWLAIGDIVDDVDPVDPNPDCECFDYQFESYNGYSIYRHCDCDD